MIILKNYVFGFSNMENNRKKSSKRATLLSFSTSNLLNCMICFQDTTTIRPLLDITIVLITWITFTI